MALKKIGASIVLEGEKEYRNALKNINAEQKELKSEMMLSNAEFKNSQNSLEALQSKYEILTKQLESQKDKVEVYNTALDEAKKKQENAGESVDKYSKELEEAQEELDKMKSSSDVSNDAIEEQEKRVKELAEQLDSANDSYEKATGKVTLWQTGLNNAQADLVNLEKDLENTKKYLDEASNSADHCASSIDEMGKKAKDTEEKVITFGEVMAANLASDVVMKGLEAMISLLEKAGDELMNIATSTAFYADSVNTMAKVTGVSTETIQALQYSEELLDVSVNTVTQSMTKNIRSMEKAKEGSENYAEAYENLGIQVTDANGELRNSEEVFWEVVDALGKMKNATERDAIAMQVFGRSAQQLNPLIAVGSKGFNSMRKEAEDLGYILDQKTLNSLNDTSDAFERLSKYGDTIKKEIGASMADDVSRALERIQSAIEKNEDKIKNVIEDVIPAIADGIVTIVENIDVIIPLLSGIVSGFIAFKVGAVAVELASAAMAVYKASTEGATIAQKLLNIAMDANPVLLLVSALVALGTAMATYSAFVGDATSKHKEYIESLEEETEKNKKAIEDRKKASEERKNDADNAKRLKDELIALNSKEKLNNDEKVRMTQIIQQLNGIYPDLNLSLAEETGHLEQTTEEINKQIEARENMMMLNAAEEDLQEIAKQKYEAEKKYAELMEEQQKRAELLTATREKLAEVEDLENISISDKIGLTNALNQAIDEQTNMMNDINKQIDSQYGLMQSLDEEYANVTGTLDGYKGQIQTVDDAYKHNMDVAIEWKDKQVKVTGEVADKLQDLEIAYINAKTKAKESIDSQIGLFDELNNKSDLSIKQMQKNFESQTEVMNTYAADMLTAKSLVSKGLMDEGLLGELQEMGLQGSGYLHELVTAAENDLPAFEKAMEAFAEQKVAKENLAATMAEIETSYTETMDNIVRVADEIPSQLEGPQQELVDSFANAMADIGMAVADATPGIEKEVVTMSEKMLKGSKDALGIQGDTSSEGHEIGEIFTDSISKGVEAGAQALYDTIDSVTAEATRRAREAAESINRMLGGMI